MMDRARETLLFPVPLSPSSSTVESVAATRCAIWPASFIAGCSPTIRGKPYRAEYSSRSSRFSRSNSCCSRRALEQQLEVIEIHRLLDEIERALFHRRHGLFHRAVRGDENEGQRRLDALRLAQHFDSGIPGELQVREDQLVTPIAHFFDRGSSVRRLIHDIARALERLAQHRPELGLIFDK